MRAAANRAQPPPLMAPHAGMGVASLILAIISLVNILLLIAVDAAAGASFQPADREESPFNYIIGGWIFAIGLIAVSGIVFGIGGLRQKDRRHSLAIVGLCMNIAMPIGIMFIMLVALSIQPPTPHAANTNYSSPNDTAAAAWRSPLARTFQSLTVGLAVGVASFVSIRRRARLRGGSGQDSGSIVCQRCRAQIPRRSKFCRRCGNGMRS